MAETHPKNTTSGVTLVHEQRLDDEPPGGLGAARAQASWLTCIVESRGYIVGSANGTGGLHIGAISSGVPVGWSNTRVFDAVADPTAPATYWIAAGNGVHRYNHSTHQWRTVTDWHITEVLTICWVDHQLWIGTAHGVFFGTIINADQVEWSLQPLVAGFCNSLLFDADHDVLWAALDDGLVRIDRSTQTTRRVNSPTGIRDLACDDLGRWALVSDGEGLWTREHHDAPWHRVPSAPANLYRVIPSIDGAGWYYGGFQTGLWHGGHDDVTPHQPVARILHEAAYPSDSPPTVLAIAQTTQDLWVSVPDEGLCEVSAGRLTPVAYPGAMIWRLRHAGADGSLTAPVRQSPQQGSSPKYSSAATPEPPPERPRTYASLCVPRGPKTAYRRRALAVIDFFATRGTEGYLPYDDLIEETARLVAAHANGEPLPILPSRYLEEAPFGDMFWMLPQVMYIGARQACLGGQDETILAMRALWQTYQPYRGDTENHWLMYHTALYLMSTWFPQVGSAGWFNGRSALENQASCGGYLAHWMHEVAATGIGEFHSPHYLPMYVSPLALLVQFATDDTLRHQATETLDALLRSFARSTVQGYYVGGMSRVYPTPLLYRAINPSTTFAWLLFGEPNFAPDALNVVLRRPGYRPHGVVLCLAMSTYEPPADLPVWRDPWQEGSLAPHEADTYVERHRTRRRIRYEPGTIPVRRVTHRYPHISLGSVQGGLLQPIQQHTWEVFWTPPEGAPTPSCFFALHPYGGAYELGMYFPEEPRLMTEAVTRHEKATYMLPYKWTGGSPHETVQQTGDTLTATYDLPDDEPRPWVQLFVPQGMQVDISRGIQAGREHTYAVPGGVIQFQVDVPGATGTWFDFDHCPEQHRRVLLAARQVVITVSIYPQSLS